jgi:hypothetical protein
MGVQEDRYGRQFEKGRSKLLAQTKQTKLLWLQDPNRVNGDNLNSRHFRNKNVKLQIVHNVGDVRQIQIHTAEPLVIGLSTSEVEIAIAKLKSIDCQVVIKFRQT